MARKKEYHPNCMRCRRDNVKKIAECKIQQCAYYPLKDNPNKYGDKT